MKNLVKYDDKYFKVSLVENKPVMIEATPEEILAHEFENMVILKDEGVDTSMYQKIIDDSRVEMHREMQNSLQQLVLSILGFSRYDGKYTVAGFNSDRNSPVANFLAEELKAKLLTVELKRDFDLTPLEKTKLKNAMSKYFKDEYEREMRQQCYKLIQNEVRGHIKDLMVTVATDKLKNVAKQLVEQSIRIPEIKIDEPKETND